MWHSQTAQVVQLHALLVIILQSLFDIKRRIKNRTSTCLRNWPRNEIYMPPWETELQTGTLCSVQGFPQSDIVLAVPFLGRSILCSSLQFCPQEAESSSRLAILHLCSDNGKHLQMRNSEEWGWGNASLLWNWPMGRMTSLLLHSFQIQGKYFLYSLLGPRVLLKLNSRHLMTPGFYLSHLYLETDCH